VIGRPESADEALWPAAHDERSWALSIGDEDLHALAEQIMDLPGAVSDIDTEASYADSLDPFMTAADLAGQILIKAGAIKRDPAWTVGRANEMLIELIGLGSWVNQLGPRFEET